MKRRTVGLICGVGLLALPATTLGGEERSSGDTQERGGKQGQLIARDSAKKRPAYAVARVTLAGDQIGKVSFRVATSPKRTPVDWGFTTRCVKGSLIDYFPGPGDFKTTTKPSGFGGTFPVPLADPDFCTFAVGATIFKNDTGKRVSVKIFNKP